MTASSPVKTETEAQVAVTKKLPSGAVVISTKSPAKQDQTDMPASDDLKGVKNVFFFLFFKNKGTGHNKFVRRGPTLPGVGRFSKAPPIS